MAFLTELWLPILLSAVGVFFASAILWMALPLHKKDFIPPPDESSILGAIKAHGFKPGSYYLPWCGGGGGGHKDPVFLEKMKHGPWVTITVMGKAPSLGRSLLGWFIFQVILCALIAYPSWLALGGRVGVAYLEVFQIVGAIALLAQAGMAPVDSIWRGTPCITTTTKIVDGVVYALIIAGVFAWLWPGR